MSDPQLAMARDVIDRLDLRGDERVLDAGCGTGRVTAVLAERVPNGTVIAVDGSEAMVEQTAQARHHALRLPTWSSSTLDEPVDAILSTATFHWITDHDAPVRPHARRAAPGGRLSAQCGGAGNVANVQAGDRRRRSSRAARLGRAVELRLARGDRRSACTPRASRTSGPGCSRGGSSPPDPKEYFTTVILGSHLERLPEADREPFVDAVLEHGTHADYVRLNILARRSST